MATGRDLVAVALTQAGDPYRLGAEAALHDPDPPAFDCSELVQWACARVGVDAPDGTVNQFPWRIPISVQQAIATPGALLFIWKGPHAGGGGGNHVAISQGNGKTIEARSTRHGVGVFDAHGRGWTHGGLVPGLDYSTATATATATVPDQEDDDVAKLAMIQPPPGHPLEGSWWISDGLTKSWVPDGHTYATLRYVGVQTQPDGSPTVLPAPWFDMLYPLHINAADQRHVDYASHPRYTRRP